MPKRLRGWELLSADRLMLMVAAGLAVMLIINQVLSENARHRDSVRQADLYSLQLSVQKYFALNGYYPLSLAGLPGLSTANCQDPKFGGSCSSPGYTYSALAQDGKSACDNHKIICRDYRLSSPHMETTSPFTLSNN